MKRSNRNITTLLGSLGLVAGLALASGCGGVGLSAEDSGGNVNGGQPRSAGVGQSGAQDFGRFRGIIEDGEIPALATLDPVGFFNEHKIELPEAECGETVCLHGMLGVQGNMINGNNCTVVLVGFNTPLDPDEFERPPLNMAIAVDTSGSMAGTPINSVKAGLNALIADLNPKDNVTLIAYSSDAEILVDSTPEADPERTLLREAVQGIMARGDTNIYSGLRTALEAVDQRNDSNLQNRVIVLSDGVATSGIMSNDRMINLGATYAERGIGITTIGVGKDFDLELMQGLSEAGSGNFYFLEDAGAVEEVFGEEIKTFMIPLAEDVTITWDGSEAYSFRAAYGTREWKGETGSAEITIPALFMASRETSDDIGPGGGRRGGGGMILLEIIPTRDEAMLADAQPGDIAGQLSMTYRKPGGSGEMVEQNVAVTNSLKPGETPADGAFDNFAVEKAFVALNVFAGFQMALERWEAGSPNAALNVLNPLADTLAGWVETEEDVDIEADLELLTRLSQLMQEKGAFEEVGAPPDPWPSD